jgi:hypothetical protein
MRLQSSLGAQVGPQTVRFPLVEQQGHFLELLVQPQLAGQCFARIFLARLALRRPGKQGFAFNLQQPRGDDDERGREVHPLFFHRVQHGQELVGDLSQRHAGDVELRPLDQVQQQIERAFENGKLDGQCGGLHPSIRTSDSDFPETERPGGNYTSPHPPPGNRFGVPRRAVPVRSEAASSDILGPYSERTWP